jgi:glycine betaine/proline transport system permease protein
MDFFEEFPELGRQDLRDIKKAVDFGFKSFSRSYGDNLEAFFNPLLQFMIWFEKLLLGAPWMVIIAIIAAFAWYGARSWKLVLGSVIAFLLIGYFGMWEDTMATLAIISVATLVCIGVGIPLGIWMARSNRVQVVITPILDVMQTIPSFVYLIPVVMLLGIGKVPGLIAVCIYAIPPIVRLTNLGIRLVDKEVLEAADAFGADYRQRLFGVQIPLALPNIFAGVNQTIMMALAMVVIASMIGVKGLGIPVLQAVANQYLALGMLNGLAIVALAIIFDRVSQAYGQRLQAHRQGVDHG